MTEKIKTNEVESTETPVLTDLQKAYKGKFIATEKIDGVATDDGDLIFTFKNGVTFRLPECLAKTMVTDKAAETKGMPLSPSQLRMMTIADELEVLLRTHYKVNVGEVDRVCQYLGGVVQNNYKLATRILWGGKNEYKTPLKEVNQVFVDHADLVSAMQKEINTEAIAKRMAEQQNQ